MNDAERNLIADLFQRVRGSEGAYRDPEAEAFIADQVARQPHAPYAMAQTLVVQNQSLQAAQARIRELEGQLADARQQTPTESGASPWGPRANEAMGAPSSFGGGGLFGRQGPGGQQGYGAPPPPPPYGYPERAPSRGGGFLSGALQTAAGVAGGALLFEGMRHMFGGDEARAAGLGDASRLSDAASADSDAAGQNPPDGGWFSGLLDGVGGDTGSAPDRAGDDDSGPDDSGDDWV